MPERPGGPIGPLLSLAGAALLVATPAAAGSGLKEWRLVDSPIVVVAPREAPDPALVHTARLGDELLSAPIGAASAAIFPEGLTLQVLGQRFAIRPGKVLPGTIVDRGASAQLPTGARVFCNSAQPLQPPLDSAGKPIKSDRFRNRIALCLVDGDRDGAVEQVFVLGARQPADLAPVSIGPFAYQFGENVPFDNFRMVLAYRKGAPLQGLILALDMQLNGRDIGAVSYTFGTRPGTIEADSERETRWKSYPNSFAFGPIGITVEGRDETDRSIRYRITSGFRTLAVEPGFALRWIYY